MYDTLEWEDIVKSGDGISGGTNGNNKQTKQTSFRLVEIPTPSLQPPLSPSDTDRQSNVGSNERTLTFRRRRTRRVQDSDYFVCDKRTVLTNDEIRIQIATAEDTIYSSPRDAWVERLREIKKTKPTIDRPPWTRRPNKSSSRFHRDNSSSPLKLFQSPERNMPSRLAEYFNKNLKNVQFDGDASEDNNTNEISQSASTVDDDSGCSGDLVMNHHHVPNGQIDSVVGKEQSQPIESKTDSTLTSIDEEFKPTLLPCVRTYTRKRRTPNVEQVNV